MNSYPCAFRAYVSPNSLSVSDKRKLDKLNKKAARILNNKIASRAFCEPIKCAQAPCFGECNAAGTKCNCIPQPSASASSSGCDWSNCMNYCTSIDQPGGQCANNQCVCGM